MKIIRHTARDMRQALRAVREQLGEDAVILSSRRTGEGVEVTAAVDFDADTLEAGGFANDPVAPPAIIEAQVVPVTAAPARGLAAAIAPVAASARGITAALTRAGKPARGAAATAPPAGAPTTGALSQSALLLTGARSKTKSDASAFQQAAAASIPQAEPEASAPSYDELASNQLASCEQLPDYGHAAAEDSDWISEAARVAVTEHVAAPRAPTLEAAPEPVIAPSAASRTELPVFRGEAPVSAESLFVHDDEPVEFGDELVASGADPVQQAREAALSPLGGGDSPLADSVLRAPAGQTPSAEAMGNELRTLRRMLENQLAHLAWNDLTRRAPIHTEILRELTEIGITPDLTEHLVRQLPEDTDLTFARRFTIAGLSQYLKVTGDRWLDDGGRVAFAGPTGVGKTTTLAKIAVRWVLRHGPRDVALVAGDSVRIGAQDQLQSLAQMLGVPVYTPEKFDQLPSLLSRLNERLVLIDTPGSSARDPQLTSRLAVLANSASRLETALVLAGSTQAGAIEEAVKHFAPANPSCCVLTKLDEAASLGGVLSILIRARMPVAYMSEGQRVPEDLRPARALELVSAAVRLAKARGAAADEDLLRRRFGRTAHGIS